MLASAQSAFYLYVHAVAEARLHGATLIGLVLAAAFHHVDERVFATKLDGALGHGEHMLRLGEHYLGVGTVATAHAVLPCYGHRCLYLKLVGAVVVDGFRRYVFEVCVEVEVLQRSHGYLHGHACGHLSYLRLVNVASEDEVAHVCNGGDGGAVVERVGQ